MPAPRSRHTLRAASAPPAFMSAEFVHLHVHSEYSLTDSTIRVGDLVAACASAGMPAVALTDQSNLFALVKFYKAAESAGIKPIAGCDLWVADHEGRALPHRLTVLCQNREGYLNLSRLLSRAYAEGRHGDLAIVDLDGSTRRTRGSSRSRAARARSADSFSAVATITLARAPTACARGFPTGSISKRRARIARTKTCSSKGRSRSPKRSIFRSSRATTVRFLSRDDFEAHERASAFITRVACSPIRSGRATIPPINI